MKKYETTLVVYLKPNTKVDKYRDLFIVRDRSGSGHGIHCFLVEKFDEVNKIFWLRGWEEILAPADFDRGDDWDGDPVFLKGFLYIKPAIGIPVELIKKIEIIFK